MLREHGPFSARTIAKERYVVSYITTKEDRTMSLFDRVRDLLSANINAMLDNAEDPEKMANEYLRQLNNELFEAKTSVAAAMADATRLNRQEAEYKAQVDEWSR